MRGGKRGPNLRMVLEDLYDRESTRSYASSGKSPNLAASFVAQTVKSAGAVFFHRPRPDPRRSVSGCCSAAAPWAAIGANTATGRPCRVMIVERPFSAAA